MITTLTTSLRRTLVLIAAVGLMFTGVGLGTANADIVVGGHTFMTSSAVCGPGTISWYVSSNTMDQYTGRYVRAIVYDYKYATWSYGGWYNMNSYGMGLSHQFIFSHRGQFYPALQYAVATASGYVYGTEYLNSFGQTNAYGTTQRSATCYI